MLRIRQVEHLARKLDFSVSKLEEVAGNADLYCEELLLLDPDKPNKKRTVLNVKGALRTAQCRLLNRVFVRALPPLQSSHGGVRRRSIKTNFQVHANSKFAFTTDISNFYQSISHKRVYRLFFEMLKCSPDVSSLCTKICTHNYHLALGLVTSPLLADQIFRPIDERIAGACRSANLIYSRFVDDITISGNFDLHDHNSGIAQLISRIIVEHGFAVQLQKCHFGRLDEGFCITRLRLNNAGHLDVQKEYIEKLESYLEDHLSLGKRESFHGPYFTRSQIRGRIEFVGWINPRRREGLLSMYRKVDWDAADQEARSRGLVAVKKQLVPSR